MQYFGGKTRIGKSIAIILNKHLDLPYFEPFCGSCGVTIHAKHKLRQCSDLNKALITMYKSLQKGWVPPKSITRDHYLYIKNKLDMDDPLTAFAGFGCSFGGKWFGGYATGDGGNYARIAADKLIRDIHNLSSVDFMCADYRDFVNVRGCIIYADPPYEGTTMYKGVCKFNHKEFWDIARIWSENNKVYISEYEAPADFECIWERPRTTTMRNKENKGIKVIERLFKKKGAEAPLR